MYICVYVCIYLFIYFKWTKKECTIPQCELEGSCELPRWWPHPEQSGQPEKCPFLGEFSAHLLTYYWKWCATTSSYGIRVIIGSIKLCVAWTVCKPYIVRAAMSAPQYRRSVTVASWPLPEARWRAVDPDYNRDKQVCFVVMHVYVCMDVCMYVCMRSVAGGRLPYKGSRTINHVGSGDLQRLSHVSHTWSPASRTPCPGGGWR
jgi:hypothetical protein